MGSISLLLLMHFDMYAVAATMFFGANDPIHFESLQLSMLSLFRVVTLEDWTDVMHINMYGCANYGYGGNEALCTASPDPRSPEGPGLGGPAHSLSVELVRVGVVWGPSGGGPEGPAN